MNHYDLNILVLIFTAINNSIITLITILIAFIKWNSIFPVNKIKEEYYSDWFWILKKVNYIVKQEKFEKNSNWLEET